MTRPTMPKLLTRTNIQDKGFAPSTIDDTLLAPSGMANPTLAAACVNNGAKSVAIYKPPINEIKPIIKALNPLLATMGVIKTNIQGIVVKSAKGMTLFPGKITARNTTKGTNISEIAIVVG